MRSLAFVVLLMLAPSLPAQTVVLVEKPALRALIPEDAPLEKIATGFRFLEGPAWNPRTQLLTFSDIPGDRLYRFDPTSSAAPTIFREPSNHANGNTTDAAGNLLTCEHGTRRASLAHPAGAVETRRVTRTAPDGTVEVLAEQYAGKPLNSPNDIVVKSDGTIWFTDPTYGLEGDPKEQAANNVFRLDPKTRALEAMASEDQPNGLCFSPDENRIYIADSGHPHHVLILELGGPGGELVDGRIFCVIDPGVPDGMRCDRDGNLWVAAGDGVHVFNPAGERLGKILVPETPANLCFGGPHGDDLYITAHTSLYRIKVTTTGTDLHAAR